MGCRVAHAATSPKRVLTLGDDRRYSCEAHAAYEGTLLCVDELPTVDEGGVWLLVSHCHPQEEAFQGPAAFAFGLGCRLFTSR